MPVEKGHTNNPNGRPKGSKNVRTQQWEELHESIVGLHAERFNRNLSDLMDSGDDKERIKAMELYLQVPEYFKPKHSRVAHVGEEGSEKIQIIVNDSL